MALHQSSRITTDGLIFSYDMSNGKSFKGGPVTNTLDTPSLNGYPTYGNGWGTYNTNQYNSNTYFSIGTISSVSNNIITTSSAHPLLSYNVVTPQTSGGGVTAGTYYTVKKLSSTTFTLHAWNGSQDGSQGYINPSTGTHKVFDDFANDVRVSVNSSSFPTMWWGPPHVANSFLVKEIIPKGFNGLLGVPATDCIRLHWIQPDGGTDGMAYGPNGAVVAGQQYTVSFWTRSVTASAVGRSLSYQIYNHGVVSPAGFSFNAQLGPVGVWTKQSMTFTPTNPNCISYWFPSAGNMKVDIANIQFEVGGVANTFVAGTRSNTQVLIDQTSTSTITANSLTYNSDGTFSFTAGSSNNATVGISNSSTNAISKSWEAWVMPTASQGWAGLFGHVASSGCTYYCNGGVCIASSNYHFNWYDNANYQFLDSGVAATSNVPVHVVGTYDATDNKCRIYINGVLKNTSGATNMSYGGAANLIQIGYLSASGNYYTGKINVIRHYYNKALTASEVARNFSALRGRFGV